MPQQADYRVWHTDTFALIKQFSHIFRNVVNSEAINNQISAEALAGAMARENHPYQYIWVTERLKDLAAVSANSLDVLSSCQYWLADKFGWIDSASVGLKLVLPLLGDLGPFNTQGATTLRELKQYELIYRGSGDDPLELEQYYDNTFLLLRDLSDFKPGDDGATAVVVAASIWAMRMVQAKQWFEQKAALDQRSQDYWRGLRQEAKDALYGEWVISGPVQMERQWKDNVDKYGYYMPTLSEKTSKDIFGNSIAIGRAMQNENYGLDIRDYSSLLESGIRIYDVDVDLHNEYCDPIAPARELFDDAAEYRAAPRRDPLVIDLDGDGARTVSLNLAAVFDHSGDGFAEQTGWVDPNDGLLALDRNGDGIINDGRELFGDQTVLKDGTKAANGFQALAELDSNKDGKIDPQDAAFSQLRVWQDADVDGYSLPYELHTLDEVGIRSINLDSTMTNTTDDQGNIRMRVGGFQKADGTTGQIADYSLSRNTTYTIANEWLEVPEDIAALPDLRGYGNVYYLDQAMVRDSSGQLKSLVEQFVNQSATAARNALMEQILFKWTGSDAIAPGSRGPHMDARRLTVLEEFFGQSFLGANGPNPTFEASVALNESYRQIFEMMYAELMAQTHLSGLYGKLSYTWDEEKQEQKVNFSSVIPDLLAGLNTNRQEGEQLLSEFARTLRGASICPHGCYQIFREHMLEIDPSLAWVIDTGGLPVYEHLHQGTRTGSPHIEGTDNADAVRGSLTEGDGWINGLNGDDVIYGTERNEQLVNGSGDALLVAGGGTDQIWAGPGDDILDGGPGDDLLYGETGNDTYIFRRGSGQDTIIDTDATAGNVDTIWLGSNLTPEDITLRRVGNNLVLKILDTTDSITVQDYFRNDSPLNRIEQIQEKGSNLVLDYE